MAERLQKVFPRARQESGTSGKLKATDKDKKDKLKFSVNKLKGTYGTLTLNKNTGAYNYSAKESKIDALGNKTVYDNFKVSVTDGKAKDTANLKFKIVGKNDAPVVGEINDGYVTYDVVSGDYTETDLDGTITASDVDSPDWGWSLAYTMEGSNGWVGMKGTMVISGSMVMEPITKR